MLLRLHERTGRAVVRSGSSTTGQAIGGQSQARAIIGSTAGRPRRISGRACRADGRVNLISARAVGIEGQAARGFE